ncbi:CYTH and CHAD domain-containing protein [Arthrobacter sp. PAMC25564]|uniref:CYTH and CHAD domain-containing protein n=1 Tax=Arthrobacter sp. PAMC25564 TaxID=2565366 RepID=UPI0010A23027|nr:CYTH and CHAD domain-containing protein [Arthrobacter sp. PAMC25564]QCB96801.1 CYTH and CHAD domain-containing protein [Arthrobacter sp. PAMC25564]
MPGTEKLEVERKFDVGGSDELPAFTSITGVDSVGTAVDQKLDAVYFDTAGLTLAGRGITLRRRTGGKDAGWHLKLPVAAGERREITEPLNEDPDTVPARLKGLVMTHTRNQELVAVAHLKTHRTAIPLFGADGTVLAEFSDDRVESRILLEPSERATWREWEVELVDGNREVLDAADTVFALMGHRPAELPSKLARALGSRYPAEVPPVPRPRSKGHASTVLVSYMHAQVEALKAHDPGVREGAPDAVHQLRVAARRMRSVLASFRRLTDKGTAQLLREELQWLAGAVGAARDTEVMRAHLNEMIGAEPPDLIIGPVQQHIDDQLGAAYEAALADGLAALGSDRYFRLLDALDAFLAAPPLAGPARKKAEGAVGRLVNAERRRLQRAVGGVDDAEEASVDAVLHEVRKSAKRLRYAAEAAVPVFGKQASRLARAAEEIQTVLGEHQDSVIIREKLRSLATESPDGGREDGFTYGRLHALEQQRGADARTRFSRAWRNSPPRPLHWK